MTRGTPAYSPPARCQFSLAGVSHALSTHNRPIHRWDSQSCLWSRAPHVTLAASPDSVRVDHGSSEYSDVTAMFRELRALPDTSKEYARQRERIVRRCLPLAEHIARRFSGRGEYYEDLVQVARLGLMNAVNRFDEEAGSDFTYFAVPTIMGEVRRHFRDNGWAVKVPRRLKELHLRIGTATGQLTQRLGRAPTASELAAELGMDRDEVVEGLVAGSSYSTFSIDSANGGDDDASLISERLGGADPELDQIENREALRPLLAGLPERERTVLALRFLESMTQSQTAELIGVSQMQVSRMLARTLVRLREDLS